MSLWRHFGLSVDQPGYRYLQDLAYVFEMSVILHILLVTAERFVAVTWPLWHYTITRSD